MNILFIVPTYKPAYIYGGPIVVVAMLAENFVRLGHKVTVYTTAGNGKEELDVPSGRPVLVDGVEVIYFRRITGDHTHISTALWKQLFGKVKSFDVVHIHSWWNILVLGAAFICRMRGVKPALSPHGMFSTYILGTNNAGIKKWIHRLVGKYLLRHTLLHVSTDMEWDESQRMIPDWNGKVIPNLVALSEASYKRPQNDVFTIGFLSRIDPKKGLDLLITALSKVTFSYRLLVAGSGDDQYIESLKALSRTLNNEQHIEWVGWKIGKEKFDFLAQLDLFALTSHSENFAIVVIESLSVGTPVLISNQVGLYKYIAQNGYGWITPNELPSIKKYLELIYNEKDNRALMAGYMPGAIKKEYEPEGLAKQYIELYQN
jgi:glycosyltransferase involved in cell wall biosynthesis